MSRRKPSHTALSQSHSEQPASTPTSTSVSEFFNRELSLLAFNHRVLAQAEDVNVPLLERLRFLCIVSSNMDEFFEVRLVDLKQQLRENPDAPVGLDHMTPREKFRLVSQKAHELSTTQYQLLNKDILPALREEKIVFLRRAEWNPQQREWLRNFFIREVKPVLTPIKLDPRHPFPRVFNKSLNFIVQFDKSDKDDFGFNLERVIVRAPRILPRVIRLPQELSEIEDSFVFLSSVMHEFITEFFPGRKVHGCYQFRVTRNSDLFVDEASTDNSEEDLRSVLEDELSHRNLSDEIMRLEVADNCPAEVMNSLVEEFKVAPEYIYRVEGPVNLARLMGIPDQVDRADLKFEPFIAGMPSVFYADPNTDFFKVIRTQDVLVHHPYESFQPVVDFIQKAAHDPRVLAIKQTVYRTGIDSVLIDALIQAAQKGKEVTVVVELLARFDEEANLSLASRLEYEGVQVVYGVANHKTHAKMLMVVRRDEDGQLRRYVHLGTGNYHPKTAKIYADYGMFTSNEEIGADVASIFNQITSGVRARDLQKLLQSPFTIHSGLMAAIDREIANANEGLPARIVAKMNSLVEPKIIKKLYEASQAGIQIDLIVRGICCLRPGVPELSENIRVRSIIGRFLEHHRIFYFRNAKKYPDSEFGDVYLSSADWMDRNFFRRVETCFPILDEQLKQRVVEEGLRGYLNDNQRSWLMQSDGSYVRVAQPETEDGKVNIQQRLMQDLGQKPDEE